MSKQLTTIETKWALVSLLTLLLWAPTANAEIERWEDRLIAANLAYESGAYIEAERNLMAAFQEAEQAGQLDRRLVEICANLAKVYVDLNDFVKAEALFKHGLVILKSAHGTVQRDIASYFKTLAAFYRAKAVYNRSMAGDGR